jgi:hypothetical protein
MAENEVALALFFFFPLVSFLTQGLAFMHRPVWIAILLISTYQVAGITGMNYHTWLVFIFIL